jgi:phosphatidylglycerophosphatase A
VVLATWFGVGLLPGMPGTWGSLAALPLAWAIRAMWGALGLTAALVLVFAVGCWAAAAVAKASAVQDPSAVVIDEVVGQWLVLIATPVDPLASVFAFLLFRLFDIWKPWPVRWVDRRIKGGFGIMLDDIAAAIYALLALRIVLAIAGAFSVHI